MNNRPFFNPANNISPVSHHQYSDRFYSPPVRFNENFGRNSLSPEFSQRTRYVSPKFRSSPYSPTLRSNSPSPRFVTSPSNSNQWNVYMNRSQNSMSPIGTSPYSLDLKTSTPNRRNVYSSGSYGSKKGANSFYSDSSFPNFSHHAVSNRSWNKRSFHGSPSSESNPGHSSNISQYVDSSVLEDPWADLMKNLEDKKCSSSVR